MKTLLATAALLTVAISAGAAPFASVDAKIGTVLTDGNGMTLYTFDSDRPGKSNCAGGCARNWPPYLVEAEDAANGAFGIITRADGSRQWALSGQPLYYWVRDRKVGDTTGDGVGGTWHVTPR